MKTELHLQTVFLNEYLTVEVDNERQLIYVEWFRHLNSQTLRESFLKLTDIVLKSKSRYWLSDARAIHYLEYADQNWMLCEMASVLKKSQLDRFARLTTREGMLPGCMTWWGN